MLVLTRKIGESILLGERIKVTILSGNGQSVKVGISAPADVVVHREEIYKKIVEQNRLAAASSETADTLRNLRDNHEI